MNPEQVVASKEEFDEVVHKVLSSGKYWRFNNGVVDKANSFLKKFQEWLEDLLTSRFSGIEDAKGISQVLSIVLIIVISLLLVIILIVGIKYLYKYITGKDKLQEILGEQITKETTPFSLREKAKGYENNGQYRMSIRYSYIGLLLLMHEKGILYIENTMTNTEIFELLQKQNSSYQDTFRKLMEVFNYTWYGQNECDEEEYEVYQSNLTRLWNEVTTYEKVYK